MSEQWQPIETCPLRERVWLGHPDREGQTGYYSTKESLDLSTWTHWMPLPDPPKPPRTYSEEVIVKFALRMVRLSRERGTSYAMDALTEFKARNGEVGA